jgi:hypothetical protein
MSLVLSAIPAACGYHPSPWWITKLNRADLAWLSGKDGRGWAKPGRGGIGFPDQPANRWRLSALWRWIADQFQTRPAPGRECFDRLNNHPAAKAGGHLAVSEWVFVSWLVGSRWFEVAERSGGAVQQERKTARKMKIVSPKECAFARMDRGAILSQAPSYPPTIMAAT